MEHSDQRMRSRVSYVLVPLAPPIIWIAYFMAVYLYAEAGCAFGWDEPSWFGLHGVAVVTALVTLAAIGLVLYFSVLSWRMFVGVGEGRDAQLSRSLGLLGVLSGGIFLAATIMVGLPAILAPPC